MLAPTPDRIPFSRPYRSRNELENLAEVLASDHAHGDGLFTARATAQLREILGGAAPLLTTSGTDALEMTARLLALGPGDEVIVPTFTFPSAANAVALAGATPVFVDIDPATGNVDPEQAAEAIGPRTRALTVMHYGGVPADLGTLLPVAAAAGVTVVEDNAHGLGVTTPLGPLGTIGAMGIQSFHDTKNVHSGEGGALVLGDPSLIERAEIIREKGTDRSRFLRGQVDKYSWVDIGSSHLMSELNAAVLASQLADLDRIQSLRHAIWDRYAAELGGWASERGTVLMSPPGGVHAAHLFWMLVPSHGEQTALLRHLRSEGIEATFHYVPLDTSRAGRMFGRTTRTLDRAADFSSRLVRLPLWAGMTEDQTTRVIDSVRRFAPVAADAA